MRPRTLGRVAGWWLICIVVLLVPAPSVQPSTISLTTVGTAKAVDFGDGVLWVLALGSDARPGQDVTEGHTDAIHLIGIDWHSGDAVSIGVPRDFWVDLPGVGLARINEALMEGGPALAARVVADLVGITPDLVLVTGFDGFRSMVGTIGGVEVHSPVAFTNEERGLDVRRGRNEFDADSALDYSRTRVGLEGGDLDRSANQQRVLLGALRQVRGREDEEGFMERTALSALSGLQTDLSPTDVYRLLQALTRVSPGRATGCVIEGTPGVEFGASVLYPDVAQARRLGNDARDDARLQGGC
jgi:LCP family protein required for cell wall assembly